MSYAPHPSAQPLCRPPARHRPTLAPPASVPRANANRGVSGSSGAAASRPYGVRGESPARLSADQRAAGELLRGGAVPPGAGGAGADRLAADFNSKLQAPSAVGRSNYMLAQR